MKYAPEQVGAAVKSARKILRLTQRDVALTSGTGLRFIIDLERGKPTCHIGKVLTVLQTLGITIRLELPTSGPASERGKA
jgi:HTH-type transcriptional regulator/antitoxin HipB